jgi:uncharacterized glyoxalase superfamily protein PhnB
VTITPLLSFHGDCQEAFTLYERTFGGTIVTMLTYAAAGPFRLTGKGRSSTPRSGSATTR